ncbi:TetR/AcrR family transcriptional regulator [Shewanella sp. SG41-4]|uniref:TetR/AcrR family transcriptional regulator n=1 Tax=Shewanella sp. SG41-4 TaxID=2760976 RepID=UPI0015FF663B|nr:TetR/AcrR family transcriptional regulator [Shewanella sp. SG41-4]MBB1439942.1 TetR/AcrR family transcriptional regulator [Shewanella sp. SG41-4]
MARPRTFNKNEVLEKILIMIWQHGSCGLSLDELARKLTLSKTSLYSAFGNKDAVLSLCLDLYERQYEQPMIDSFKGEKVSDCIRNFLAFSSRRFEALQTPPGCFMFNCAIECSSLSASFKDKVEQGNSAFRQSLKLRVLDLTTNKDPEYIDSLVDMLLVNLFGLASASRMNFPLSGTHLTLLDKCFE